MKKKLSLFVFISFVSVHLFAQSIGLNDDGTPAHTSAMLDVKSVSKGLLVPRMTQAQRNAISSPALSLIIYQTDGATGFYYYNGSIWTPVTGNVWGLNGNAGTDPNVNFIGTTDNQPLIFKFNNEEAGRIGNTNNTAFGRGALLNNTTSGSNTAYGVNALRVNTSGEDNTAMGVGALNQNTTGTQNTSVGAGSLTNNTTGNGNTTIGAGTLVNNTTGFFNNASGLNTLLFNTTGSQNTGYGTGSLTQNTTGNDNTAVGSGALAANTTGIQNIAIGSGANVGSNNLTNATTIGTNSRVDCNNCLVLGSVNGINNATSNISVGIGTTNPNTSAALDISGTGKGVLIPRMTQSQRDAIVSPSTSLMIYQTDGVTGFYYYTGSAWAAMTVNTNSLWSTNGNAGTNSGNFIGTSDNQPLNFKINNQSAGKITTRSTALGLSALGFSSGVDNTAIGNSALLFNSSGGGNTSIGTESLRANTTGFNNTAVGLQSMYFNTAGAFNTAIGAVSLSANQATANSGFGSNALESNTTGSYNTAGGAFSLNSNITGSQITAIGANANVSTDGLSNSTAIGYGAIVDASNKVRIGNASVTVIEGQVPFTTPSDGRYKYNVREDVKGLDFILKLRPVTYQFDVKKLEDEMHRSDIKNSNYIMQASYKEAASIRRTGFIAQEVERAAEESGYNFSGINKPQSEKDHYGLSYESFVVPLVKAVQEQQKEIERLQKENNELKKLKDQLDALSKKLETLSANK